MAIKTTAKSSGSMTPKAWPRKMTTSRPGSKANIKTSVVLQGRKEGSMSGSTRRSSCDIKTKAM